MICPECQTVNADSMNFCGKCGAPLSIQTSESGQKIIPHHVLLQMAAEPQQVQELPGKKESKMKTALITMSLALAALAAVVALFFAGVLDPVIGRGGAMTARISDNRQDAGAVGKTGEEDGEGLYDARIVSHAEDFFLEAEGKNVTVLETSYDEIAFAEVNEDVQEAIDGINAYRALRLRDAVLNNAQTIYNAFLTEEGRWPWQLTYEITVDRADKDVISFAEAGYDFSGGVQGSTMYEVYNIDAATGEPIEIDDIVTDYHLLALAIEEEMEADPDERFEEVLAYHRGEGGSVAAYIEAYYLQGAYGFSMPWTLTKEGLHIWFNDYMLGAYMFGALDVVIPCEKHPELFADTAYFAGAETEDKETERIERQEDEAAGTPLSEYCLEEGSFLLADFGEIAGVYISEQGDAFVIEAYGGFADYMAAHPRTGVPVFGSLRLTPDGYEMYEHKNDNAPQYAAEDCYYGRITVEDEDTLTIETPQGTQSCTYSEEQTLLMQGFGKGK